jgi:hypothetical protein
MITTKQELAKRAHDALDRAGYAELFSIDDVGYVVSWVKTFGGTDGTDDAEIHVSHAPPTDDPATHTRQYYAALRSDHVMEGVHLELMNEPYPVVRLYV